MKLHHPAAALLFFASLHAEDQAVITPGTAWMRHTIDNTARGADGTKLGDVNRDGLPDIVTGWEEGGVVRVYVNPGAAKVREP